MLGRSLDLALAWRGGAPYPEALRRRIEAEVREVSWVLSEMQALVADAHRLAGDEHAYLLPRLEARLPLYDEGVRLRVLITHRDRSSIILVDEAGRKVADVVLV